MKFVLNCGNVLQKALNYIFLFLFEKDELIEFLQKNDFEDNFNFLNFNSIRKLKSGEVFSIFSYEDERIKNLIWQFKFNNCRWLAKFFGYFLAKEIKRYFYKNSDEILIIPIPIHKKRLSERGYNQCELLCEEIIKKLPKNFIYNPKILKRIKYSKKQSWQNKKERQQNIAGVFSVNKKFINEISDRKIILIDDVYTTGATIKEVGRTLKLFGPQSIKCFTVAR